MLAALLTVSFILAGLFSSRQKVRLGSRYCQVRHMVHTLVLLRHGESAWNKLNVFTGWVDVELTGMGWDVIHTCQY